MLTLGYLGHASPSVMDFLTRSMSHSDENIAMSASTAFALLGGDPETATMRLIQSPDIDRHLTDADIPVHIDVLIRAGRVHVGSLEGWLDRPNWSGKSLAIMSLAACGRDAAGALPTLRPLCGDRDRQIALRAKYAVKRIEWEVEHPDEAAKRRLND